MQTNIIDKQMQGDANLNERTVCFTFQMSMRENDMIEWTSGVVLKNLRAWGLVLAFAGELSLLWQQLLEPGVFSLNKKR